MRKLSIPLPYITQMVVPPVRIPFLMRLRVLFGYRILVEIGLRTQHRPGMMLPVTGVHLTPHKDPAAARDDRDTLATLFDGEPKHPDELVTPAAEPVADAKGEPKK